MLSVFAFAVGRLLVLWPGLPEPLASHFDASGTPDGFSSRAAFVSTVIVIHALLVLVFLLVPALLRITPASLVSLPNREYWWDPSRRDATISTLASYFLYFGISSQVVAIVAVELTVRANLGHPFDTGPMWGVLALHAVNVAGWLLSLLRRFRKPPTRGEPGFRPASTLHGPASPK